MKEIVLKGAEAATLPLEAQPLYSMEIPGMMKQIVFRCPNGYGLSVVEGFANYCSFREDRNDHSSFEVALIWWPQEAADNEFELVYAKGTPWLYDVLGWQTVEDIAGLLLVASRVTEHSDREICNWDDDEVCDEIAADLDRQIAIDRIFDRD